MSGYTKLFHSIVTSSIWSEDDKTRICWITLLAIADKNGEVQAAIPGLARLAGVSLEDAKAAIEKFLSPDPYSRTPDDEGRRIEPIDGGWAILNHGKYREMASREELREAEAKRKARYRAKTARNKMSQNVPDMSHDVPKNLHIAEAEAEADTDNKEKKPPKSPKGDSRQAAQVLPESFSEESKQAISEWETFRREIKKSLTPSTRRKVIEAMTADPAGTIASINRSITNGWQGLFPDNDTRAAMGQAGQEPKKPAPKAKEPEGWQAVYATLDPDPVFADGEYCAPDWDRLSPAERSEISYRMAAMPSESTQRGLNGSGNVRTAKGQIEASESKFDEIAAA